MASWSVVTAYEETGNLHSADPKIQVNALSDQKALTSYVKDICMRCTAMHAPSRTSSYINCVCHTFLQVGTLSHEKKLFFFSRLQNVITSKLKISEKKKSMMSKMYKLSKKYTRQ